MGEVGVGVVGKGSNEKRCLGKASLMVEVRMVPWEENEEDEAGGSLSFFFPAI